jgi:hypothetical protein
LYTQEIYSDELKIVVQNFEKNLQPLPLSKTEKAIRTMAFWVREPGLGLLLHPHMVNRMAKRAAQLLELAWCHAGDFLELV